jgi:hypothetical protein
MKTFVSETGHLLESSLDWMHTQTVEWLQEADFWKDETVFFYNLLRKTELRGTFPAEHLAALENELICITGQEITALKIALRQHEELLKSLLTKNSTDREGEYRHKHREIMVDVVSLENRIRDYKKSVFNYVKNV